MAKVFVARGLPNVALEPDEVAAITAHYLGVCNLLAEDASAIAARRRIAQIILALWRLKFVDPSSLDVVAAALFRAEHDVVVSSSPLSFQMLNELADRRLEA